MNYAIPIFSCLILMAGCQSAVTPLHAPLGSLTTVDATTEPSPEPVVAPSTQPATQAASTTQTAATQVAATQAVPGSGTSRRTVDPDRTSRFVYHASYDNIWRQATRLLTYYNYRLDIQDYRRGVLTTLPLGQAQIGEIWRRDAHGLTPALEALINHQKITLRLTINAVPGKPGFYEITAQALVERESNPDETITPASEVTAFGANVISSRSDYDAKDVSGSYWTLIGHDRRLERKVLDELFKKI